VSKLALRDRILLTQIACANFRALPIAEVPFAAESANSGTTVAILRPQGVAGQGLVT